jgi:hypothetical protein
MDRNPLIGVSIIAVVLLVLGSLTNVVGYQSVQSTAMNDSPLFSMRTKKATNQACRDTLTFNYLGKGKDTLLQFPTRDNNTESVIKAIDFISKMDDKTFKQFRELCIQRVRQDNTFSDTNPNEISQILYQLRTKPETIINSIISRNNYNITSKNGPATICYWIPTCILTDIALIILFIYIPIYLLIDRLASVLHHYYGCSS